MAELDPIKKSYKIPALIISAILALLTFAVYWQALGHDFIAFYDDVLYVTENKYVQAGLTLESIVWAFTTGYGANWHPLTWLSHMLDCQLYGMNPMGHHLTNLLFHIANTLLLFFVLKRMTAGFWQSAFVAALFALHPLHVESVAWVAERKDVLSTFFWMLTMLAYLKYVENPLTKNYLLIALFLSLGLMAKPMLVTLPFVLLLLDYWPLRRFHREKFQLDHMATLSEQARPGRDIELPLTAINWNRAFRLVKEKVPLIALIMVSSIATYIAQRKGGAVQPVESLPLNIRIANAFVAYLQYIIKMIWPSGLSAFYPHPGNSLPMWQAVAAGLVLLVITVLVLRAASRHSYLALGWFWYLGTLVPVIGLVQVGSQAMADRYTYIPLIGLFMVVAWGVPDLLHKVKPKKIIISTTAAVVMLALVPVTWIQVGYWRDAITLFGHTVEITPDSWLAHSNLGASLVAHGKRQEAMAHFTRVLSLKPEYAEGHYNMAVALAGEGKKSEALKHYSEAIRLKPEYVGPRLNMGVLLVEQGKNSEAVNLYREALRIQPDYAELHLNLAIALANEGKTEEAISSYLEAIRLKPDLWQAHFNLGYLLAKSGRLQEAVARWNETLRLKPDYADAHYQLGQVLAQQGNRTEARSQYSEALRLNPNLMDAHYTLGLLLAEDGKSAEAITHLSEALRINPNYEPARKSLEELINRGGGITDPKVHYNLGTALDSQGKIAEAIVQYNAALRLQPEYPDAHNNLGVALGKLGRFDESTRHLSEALRLKPEYAEAHNNLGIVLAMQGKTAEAIDRFSEAVRLNPDYANARFNLGLVLAKAGKVREAAVQYSEALRIKPDYAEAQRELDKLRALENKGKL